jgi:hypothetical protein
VVGSRTRQPLFLCLATGMGFDMAYARFSSHSDVYVYEDVGGFLCCMRCDFSETRETRTKSRGEMIEHLEVHRRAGQKVPEDALEELRAEIAKLGDSITQ